MHLEIVNFCQPCFAWDQELCAEFEKAQSKLHVIVGSGDGIAARGSEPEFTWLSEVETLLSQSTDIAGVILDQGTTVAFSEENDVLNSMYAMNYRALGLSGLATVLARRKQHYHLVVLDETLSSEIESIQELRFSGDSHLSAVIDNESSYISTKVLGTGLSSTQASQLISELRVPEPII